MVTSQAGGRDIQLCMSGSAVHLEEGGSPVAMRTHFCASEEQTGQLGRLGHLGRVNLMDKPGNCHGGQLTREVTSTHEPEENTRAHSA